MKAWHFLPDDGRLTWGSKEKVKVGQTIKVAPPLKMCFHGLHASKRLIDALEYAPGALCCRVELSGEIFHDTDKSVATERTVLWMVEATRILHEFVCRCAEDVLKAAGVTDPRRWAMIKAKRRWLKGEITNDELVISRNVSWVAAWAAATARCAARDADAARDAQNQRLTAMVSAAVRH